MNDIKEILKEFNIERGEEKEIRIRDYIKELNDKREWAHTVSKGFKKNAEEMVTDSMMLLKVIEKNKKEKIVDIGSGGGLVGVTISIICEKWDITMVEKSMRKSAFLAEMIAKFNIENARVLNIDAVELIGKNRFDISVTRAAGKLKDVMPLGLGAVLTGGRYIAIKGSEVEKEVEDSKEAIQANGGKLINIVKPVIVEGVNKNRVSLVVIEKVM